MPPRAKAAQSSTAKALVAGNGVNAEALESFLGGFAPGGATVATDQENESAIVVQLKLLQKSSDVTKQKALNELISRIESSTDDAVYPYGPSIVEAVIQNASYTNPVVRGLLFRMLSVLMNHGKEVKKSLVNELPALSGVWVMAMNDMEESVCSEAVAAFEAAFSAEKRPEFLLQYKDAIVAHAIEKVEDSVATCGKGLQDDQLDPKANVVFSAIGALSYMVQHVSTSQQAILSFVTDNETFSLLVPTRERDQKKYLLQKTPRVRSSTLSLLRAVICVCPCGQKLSQIASSALVASFPDKNVNVVSRAWELLLHWCRIGVTAMIDSLPPRFFDEIIDSVMNCDKPEVAEVIFPCLLPLLVQITKDSRCTEVLDEFCGALVEKLRVLGETPNISASELQVVLTATVECWELHCLRFSEINRDDSMELLTVIVFNLVLILHNKAKLARYFESICGVLCTSLSKTLARNEVNFRRAMTILCDDDASTFKALPDDADASMRATFKHLYCTVVGRLYESVGAKADGAKQAAVVESFLVDILERLLAEGDCKNMCYLLRETRRYKPSEKFATAVVQYVVKFIQSEELRDQDQEAAEVNRSLVPIALGWGYPELSQRITEATKADNVQESVKGAITEHYLQSFENTMTFLCTSCEEAQFDDIKCALEGIAKNKHSLGEEEIQLIERAVLMSLTAAATSLGDKRDSEEASEATESTDSENDDSESSSSGDSDESEAEPDNEAGGALDMIVEWCHLLQKDGPLCSLLQCASDGEFIRQVYDGFVNLCALVSPRLYPEQYVSVRAVRSALQNPEDTLAVAMGNKRHHLKTADFNDLTETVTAFLDSHDVPTTERDGISRRMLDNVLSEEGKTSSLAATHQIQYLVPFASDSFIKQMVEDVEFWKLFVVPTRQDGFESLPLFDGFFALNELDVSLESAVRTAQLIRLVDYSGVGVDETNRPELFLCLLRAASRREVLCPSIVKLLFDKLLPTLFDEFVEKSAASAFSNLLHKSQDKEYMLCTLGAVIQDMAAVVEPSNHVNFLLCGRHVMSSVPLLLIDTLFSTAGATIKISDHVTQSFTTFFRLMDRAADNIKDNMMINVSKENETVIREAIATLPSRDILTAKLTLIIHRHIHTLPVVEKATATAVIEFAQKQKPIDALELLAELSCTRIMDMDVFSNLVRHIVDALCRCYALRHLPTNGRLRKYTPNKLVPEGPASFDYLRRVVMAAVLARHGVVIHSRMDDVLRSTVNLVVFDVVCEAISQLRTTTKDQDLLPFAKVVSFTQGFLQSITSFDVSVFRASEISVEKISTVFSFANAWLHATSISKMESIGIETVTGVLRCACMMTDLTLTGSKFPLHAAMRSIIAKNTLKPVRQDFSTSNPAKLSTFKRFNQLINKTHKQKILLFPYLLSWCIYLSTPPTEEEAALLSDATAARERRDEVYQLLDLLFVLMISPTHKGSKRLEETFLGSLVLRKEKLEGDELQIGRSTAPLTRLNAENQLNELAKGAATVFAYLMKGNTLTYVKNWLETIERKTSALVVDFVSMFVSPALISENLRIVMSHSPDREPSFALDDNFSVEVSFPHKCINLSYEMEDVSISMRISFPEAFPLRQPVVDSSTARENGISSEKWRSWVLKMTVLLFSGTSDIWGCVELFHRNMDAHFNGQEPCPICFAVVNSMNHKLPDKRCSVCKNARFHAYCLGTWWASCGQTICPLCRSPWV